MSTVVLQVDDVHVRYGDVHAVQGAGFRVRGTQMVALTGSSGAGKTSLLWALAGALRPAAGAISLDRAPIAGREQAARSGVVLVPQGNALASALTAGENVWVPMLAAGTPPGEARELALASLARVGLEDSAGHLVEELSGGQQQRVAVARALALPARVLLADEPTSDLDATNRERVLEALREVARRGAVVLVSTHDPDAAAVADGELHLDEGRPTWVRPLVD